MPDYHLLADEDFCELISLSSNLLASLYLYEPTDTYAQFTLRAWKNGDARQIVSTWPFAPADEARKSFETILRGLNQGTATSAIVDEFDRLFRTTAPLVPTSMGVSDALGTWMERNGISPMEVDEPVDHVGVMLYLLGWLAKDAPEMVPVFMADYLMPHCIEFFDNVVAASTHPLYIGTAELGKATLVGLSSEF